MYSLIFMSSCILFRIYCKNSELLRSQIQSVHKNVYVENVKKRGVFGRLMGKRVSLKKYWEYKRETVLCLEELGFLAYNF